MIFRKANPNDLKNMNELWNEVVKEEYFLKPMTYEEFSDKLLTNPDFDYDSVTVVYENEKLIAFSIGYLRKKYIDNPDVAGIVNMIMVKKEYRKQGIGSKLLKDLETYFKEHGRNKIAAAYFLPSCYSWYIPNTNNHDHPCAPGIRLNSNEYFFLLHRGYETYAYQDAFHLDLSDYELSDSVNKILEEKYPETDEMNTELNDQAENYYNMYNQYYGYSKEEFLTKSGFGSERAFIEYLRLQYRRTQYTDDYIKEQITDKEIEKYYEDKVYGDINTKHILVKVSSSATDEEKKEAENLAKEIITKLNEGKSFDEVKDEYKDKITYEELGYKAYNASLESAYMEAMQKLENNSYTKEPVQTSYGYHVIYRIDQKEKPALKDVKEEIITSLVSEHKSKDTSVQYKALDKMREDAKLKFTDTVLEKKYETYKSQYNK